ncbi:MAG: hypothetical protein GC137_09535 [Alphaproteobacteria bacterium]|nr:hypothetical protein [Alphaproteobacteria bacterium]
MYFFRERKNEKPWLIDLAGDNSSGKSLLALAVDSCFRPHIYQGEHIPSFLSVDKELEPNGDKPVVFHNFFARRIRYLGQIGLFEDENPEAEILFVGNTRKHQKRAYKETGRRDTKTGFDARIDISFVLKQFDLARMIKDVGLRHGLDIFRDFRKAAKQVSERSRPVERSRNIKDLFWRRIEISFPDKSLLAELDIDKLRAKQKDPKGAQYPGRAQPDWSLG